MLNSLQRAKLRKAKKNDGNVVNVYKGKKLNISARLQQNYHKALRQLTLKMTREVNAKVKSFLNTPQVTQHFASDAGITAQLDKLTKELEIKFKTMFDNSAPKLAEDMANQADKSSLVSVTGSLRDASKDLTIKLGKPDSGIGKIAQAVVEENVKLIKSIPEEYMDEVNTRMKDSFVNAVSVDDVLDKVVEAGEITERRAKIIALDQTRKAYSALNTVRMKSVGISKAEWIHSGGGVHPRPSHIALDGTDFDLAEGAYDEDEGEYIMPGELVNCSCTMRPVIELTDDQNGDET